MIIVQVDLQIPLPQSLINFIMKNVAGVFLTLFQRQVIKVSYRLWHVDTNTSMLPPILRINLWTPFPDPRPHLHPSSFFLFPSSSFILPSSDSLHCTMMVMTSKVAANPDTPHGQNIRGDLEFYEGWLLPKLRYVLYL